jgi:hypothetical protein
MIPKPVWKPPVAPIVASLVIWGALMWAVAGCTTDRTALDPQKVAQAQAQMTVLCSTAMALSPIAGPYAPFIIAGCATEEAIGRLASDPSSVDWLNGIIVKVRKHKP